MTRKHQHGRRHGSSPSPRSPSGHSRPSSTGYGEGRGEGLSPQAQTRGEAPSLPSPASGGGIDGRDLSPHSPSKTGVDALMRGRGKDRIAKVMARAGLCSRRDAEALIAAGRVAVNAATT